MNSSTFLGMTTFAYLFTMVLYFYYLFFRSKTLGIIIRAATIIALLLHTTGLGLRWYESYQLGYGHIPLSNMYEALVSMSWCIVLVLILMEQKFKTETMGAFVLPLVSLMMAYASLAPNVRDEIEPLIPALQSNWLTYHVMTCFLGYAAFAVSFGASIAYLMKNKEAPPTTEEDSGTLPALEMLDELIYKANAVGFLLLGIGIITGAVWANYAWGSYWSWDPKETWSLITWLIYAAFLHARLTRGWRGRKTAILSIIGFCGVLFTFFGVNYVLSGLHSYASD
jgi:cytochrome c-type biogenesis protein CcsB